MALSRWFSRAVLALFGWRATGDPPAGGGYVLIGFSHTSNWDLPLTLALAWALGIRVRWAGKTALFRWPYGWFFRLLRGIPVDRQRSQNFVEQMAEQFEANPGLVLAIAPEATRRPTDHWRSGFYYIALAAGVPIVLGFLDYGRRTGGTGPAVVPTGEVEADMDRIREFYAGVRGRHPAKMGRIHLKSEGTVDSPAPLD